MSSEGRGGMSEAEWAARVDCAAVYRLIALYGWDDLIFTHVSARVPGEPNHFLINPYGWLFEEMTASSLVKIDLDGNVVEPTPHDINPGAIVIHSAVHAAREDVACMVHLHTPALVGVSSQTHGLLPLTQTSLLIASRLAYHDYEGATIDADERGRIAESLGRSKIMLLRHHGGLTAGRHAADAFMEMYFLQRACEQQIASFSAGAEKVMFPAKRAQEKVLSLPGGEGHIAKKAWPALLRKLDRLSPGYDA